MKSVAEGLNELYEECSIVTIQLFRIRRYKNNFDIHIKENRVWLFSDQDVVEAPNRMSVG